MLSLVREVFPRAHHVGADFFRSSGWILEISPDRDLNLLTGVQQPENNEQRHHGGDEVRVGHLPGAAMMAAVATFFLEDHDGPGAIHNS
jgi:hypothetical protein